MIKEILKNAKEGKNIKIRGWVYRHRKLGDNKIFFVVRDSSSTIQCVVERNNPEWEKAENLYIESSIEVEGTLKKDERAPHGWEIKVDKINIIHLGKPFPFSKDLSEELKLNLRHLWIRSRQSTEILKLKHHIINYLREFLNKNKFYEVQPPIITKAGAEGGADMFEINYFGEKAYLTQSSQLYMEALIYSLERVYALAPSFRAEKSRTRKHLAEFWHLEPEAAFIRHKENIELQENLISYAIEKLTKNHEEELKQMVGEEWFDMLKKTKPPFPKMSYEEAIEKVNELGGKMSYGDDFGADEEALLTQEYEKPLIITNFPLEIKAFYMAEDESKPGTALNNDVLAPKGHGEIIGGSEREWRYEKLIERMKEQKLNIENYKWYIELREYGSIPHSGFGLGIERFVKYVLNLNHIRDAIAFPRTINRVEP